MPRIYLEVELQYTVIQQVSLNSVTLTLTMMQNEVAGTILKADVHKEDDADPPLSLWYSWFYISWKTYRYVVHLLEENWKHLLGISWKFGLRWWKRRQLRSWVAFGKRYQSFSHITHSKYIKGRSVSHINKGGRVDTQKIYQWSVKGGDCYILWFIQRRWSTPILKDCYLPMRECMKRIDDCSWWEWDTGSSLFFWKWPQLYQAWAR